MKILVIGAGGQLGRCIYDVVEEIFGTGCLNHEYYFVTHTDLDITNLSSIYNYLYCHFIPDCIINCAAYTNVEKAEDDIYSAFKVNSLGVKNLVDICEEFNIMLMHISTDYVYKDKIKSVNEDDDICPLSIYGQSKRDGEIHIINSNLNNWYIFRTSWLYSEYGNNFLTKIINKFNSYESIFGVIDELGSPTYARKLAEMMISIIEDNLYSIQSPYEIPSGIYNFSGLGVCSRYDFVNIIVDGLNDDSLYLSKKRLGFINPITQEEANKKWNLKAKRPLHVILDNSKINKYYDGIRDNWVIDLGECLNRYDNLEKRKKLNKPL